MSRIGKQIIKLPTGVTVKLATDQLIVRGPKGELRRPWPAVLELVIEPPNLRTAPKTHQAMAIWGTYTSHLKNMVRGVSEGFEKRLVVEGVGYRLAKEGGALTLRVGFSHPVKLPVPADLKVEIDKNLITVSGSDRELVAQFAARVRAVRPPDSYKEKGIRYADETVLRKSSSKMAAAA